MSYLIDINLLETDALGSEPVTFQSDGTYCLHKLFEQQAARHADSVAAVFEGREVTYRDLNARANRIAWGLGLLADETVIGVYLERSIEMVAAMLGTLKAGAAYLPIDPSLPAERVRFMLRDASATVVITNRTVAAAIGPETAKIFFVEDLLKGACDGNLDIALTPERLACVIFTSGSTGQPKGVEIRHAGMFETLRSVAQDLDFTNQETVLAATSQAFDVSGLELFLPLLSGGRVVLLPQGQSGQSDRMIEAIEEHSATLLCGTPSMWRLLAKARWEGSDRLRIICGGEPLDSGLASFLVGRTRGVWNQYGPTETSIVATSYRVKTGDLTIPIGTPLPHIEAFILDDKQSPVQRGEAGELCLGGTALARGYRNRPELTAEKFTYLTLPDKRTERVYRTGDRVRELPDGNLLFLNRLDNQVKVRGYRIELEEIEARLLQHTGVSQAVVVVHGKMQEERTLAAYYVEPDGRETAAKELRAFLSGCLPGYMVPSHFVRLARMPLASSGKADRAKLAARKLAVIDDAPIPEDFGTETERELLKIWRRMLNRTGIAKTDKFFDVGGHSLMAASLFAEIAKRFEVRLPLSTFTAAPTIEALARLIDQRDSIPEWSPLVPIQETGDRPPFFCVHGIHGNVVSFQNVSKHLGAWQPFYAFQARGLDGRQAPHTDIEAMAADYLELTRKVQPTGPYLLGGFSAGGFVALEMARLLRKQGEAVALLAIIDGYLEPERAPRTPAQRVRELWRWTVKGVKARIASFQELDQSGRRDALSQDWQRAKAVAMAGPRKLAGGFGISMGKLTPFAAFLNAVRTYRPQPFGGRVMLFQSTRPGRADLTESWRKVMTGHLEIRQIEGHHDDLMREPMVLALATELDLEIEAALEDLER